MVASKPLIDGFGRAITYLRVSVTDRCDLRCVYCMSEHMVFRPKPDLLSFDELERLCTLFVSRGVRKLRFTGGEPLVRKGVIDLIERVSVHLRHGALDEITLTTNATQLAAHAVRLAQAGVKRVNVSLDTLDRAGFARITRRDRLPQVLEGIEAAHAAGLTVKINTVALNRDNAAELPAIAAWAHASGMDITFIETMPLGDVGGDRIDQYLSLRDVRRALERVWTLEDDSFSSGGPARYVKVHETGRRVGFITPISNVFCATCNRVRLTCTGELFLCLGRDVSIDFATLMRNGASDNDLGAALDAAVERKPLAHDFDLGLHRPAVARHMSVTGG